MLHQLTLTQSDIGEIRQLLGFLTQKFSTPEEAEFLHNASIYAHDLPLSIRRSLNDFRLNEIDHSVVHLISGYPIDEEKIGLTPSDRIQRKDTLRTLEEQFLLMLCSALLGDVFGWATQQSGVMIQDVLPVKGKDSEQIGSSSLAELMWHTEESFHPYRCDYVGLMCLRNPQRVATTLASDRAILKLDEKEIQILFEPRFIFQSDISHVKEHKTTDLKHLGQEQEDFLLKAAYERIHKMNEVPSQQAVLYGDFQQPYMCIDSIYIKGVDQESENAAQSLIKAIDEELTDLVLEPGDICFIDNYRAVHGRRAFTPTYDGNDRWLKRSNITRDLKKSRGQRISRKRSRIIF